MIALSVHSVQDICGYLHPRDIIALARTCAHMHAVIAPLISVQVSHDVESRYVIDIVRTDITWPKLNRIIKSFIRIIDRDKIYIDKVIEYPADYRGLICMQGQYRRNIYYMYSHVGFVRGGLRVDKYKGGWITQLRVREPIPFSRYIESMIHYELCYGSYAYGIYEDWSSSSYDVYNVWINIIDEPLKLVEMLADI